MHTRPLALGLPAVFVLALVIALVSFPFVPEPAPVSAANLEVNTTEDASAYDGTCDDLDNGDATIDCTLREAIEASVGGDTILLDNVSGTIILDSALPSLTDSTIISGPGPDLLTVDANGTGRVFEVPFFGAVTISGIRITGGLEVNGGGVLLSPGATATLNDVEVSGNTASEDGGGIYVDYGAVLTLENGSVVGTDSAPNAATRGGGIYVIEFVEGAGAAVISSSVIGNNTASSTGGGIYVGEQGSLELTGVEVNDNTAIDGAGLYIGPFAVLTMEGSTIAGNISSGDGGGLDVDGGSAELTNSTLSGNSATGNGAAIHLNIAEVGSSNLTHVTVTDNTGSEALFADDNTGVDLVNTLIAANSAANCSVSDTATFNSVDSLSDDDTCPGAVDNASSASLGPLQDNGGSTRTHALVAGNPAIDGVMSSDACGEIVFDDQRGIFRPSGPFCDVGAFESQPDLLIEKTNDLGGNDAIIGVPFTWTITVAAQDVSGSPGSAVFYIEDTILQDDLPLGATYGQPTVELISGVGGNGAIHCFIEASLFCYVVEDLPVQDEIFVSIAPGGSFEVSFTVTPDALGELFNPADQGVCAVDWFPFQQSFFFVNEETTKDNNECSDSVTVSDPPTATPEPTQTNTPEPTPTGTPVPTGTPTPLPTQLVEGPTNTPIPDDDVEPAQATVTPTGSATVTPTATVTPSATATTTPTPAATFTATVTSGPSVTPTPVGAIVGATETPGPDSTTPTPDEGTPQSGTPTPTAAPDDTTTPTPTPASTGSNGGSDGSVERTSFVQSVNGVRQVSGDFDVIFTNALLTGTMLILIFLTSEIFNQTIRDNQTVIEGWAGNLAAPFVGLFGGVTAVTHSALAQHQNFLNLFWILVVLVVSVFIEGFLEPGFPFNDNSLLLFLSLLVSVGFMTYLTEGAEAFLARKVWHESAAVRVFPLAIVIAALCVIFSRAGGIAPGVLYGFVGTAIFLRPSSMSQKQEGLMIFLPISMLLAMSVGAWLLIDEFRPADPRNLDIFIEGVLVGIFIGGIEGIFINMIPIAYLDGSKIIRWSKLAWFGLTGVTAFLFWHILLNDQREYFEAIQATTPVIALIVVGLCLCLSILTWLFFRYGRRWVGL